MKQLNKFEKKFIKIDFFSTATIFGGVFILLSSKPNLVNLIIAVIVIAYYYFRLRKAIWKNLEKQEKIWLSLPEEERNLFDSNKTKDLMSMTNEVKSQWSKR